MTDTIIPQEEPKKNLHCFIVNRLSVCFDPSKECYYFKAGFVDCFFYIQGRCCNSVAISSAKEFNPAALPPGHRGLG